MTITLNREAIEKYRQISIALADPNLHVLLKKLTFEKGNSLAELLDWLHSVLKWSNENIKRHSDPINIIAYGKGKCGEFSILFTAVCLAKGYRARIILDMSDHVWTEVWDKNKKNWIHVDPSEKKIDDPYMYERDWKKNLQEIYAFEGGKIENVTERYKYKTAKTRQTSWKSKEKRG